MGNKSLLIVDSEIERADRIAGFFNNKVYNTFVSANAIESLDILKEEHMHVVLISADMPGLAGTSLLNLIRNIDPNVCVILFSSTSDFNPVLSQLPENIEYIEDLKAKTAVIKKINQSFSKYNKHIKKIKKNSFYTSFKTSFPNVRETGEFKGFLN